MGAAGDMLMSALYELLDNKEEFLNKMNSIMPSISVVPLDVFTCGIAGTHMQVLVHGQEEHSHDHNHGHDHGHDHSHDHEHSAAMNIKHIISHLDLPEQVKTTAYSVYDKIAMAEAKAHGTTVEMVHFHEVGALDAVCDVVGASLALHMIDAEKIIVSPICTGSGFVRCAHGVVPVPAPATAEILKGCPSYAGDIKAELCTPTGAAILTSFADSFGEMPIMRTEKIGYGIGTKDFQKANCVRAFLGETADEYSDEVGEISCNIDDMTAEELAYVMEKIMDSGALDVAAIPVVMKKGRPAHILLTLCKTADIERMAKLILRESTSNGVRIKTAKRMVLKTSFEDIDTEFGKVKIKCAEGFGIKRAKAEYADIAKLATEHNLAISQVNQVVKSTLK